MDPLLDNLMDYSILFFYLYAGSMLEMMVFIFENIFFLYFELGFEWGADFVARVCDVDRSLE